MPAAAQPKDAGKPAAPRTCEEIQQRIDERRSFLQIRQAERMKNPLNPNFSPYCMEHPTLPDCQLPTNTPARQDVSRSVGEVSTSTGREVVEQDPVIVPLQRQQKQLKCPGSSGAGR